ncbi:MAG: hypothetical protein OXE86_11910 [Alphaproteobacteria bacterium]|nr:hypothetical protein [Alphaproteobacteria bacterium]
MVVADRIPGHKHGVRAVADLQAHVTRRVSRGGDGGNAGDDFVAVVEPFHHVLDERHPPACADGDASSATPMEFTVPGSHQ